MEGLADELAPWNLVQAFRRGKLFELDHQPLPGRKDALEESMSLVEGGIVRSFPIRSSQCRNERESVCVRVRGFSEVHFFNLARIIQETGAKQKLIQNSGIRAVFPGLQCSNKGTPGSR